jgi:hypothetical protein
MIEVSEGDYNFVHIWQSVVENTAHIIEVLPNDPGANYLRYYKYRTKYEQIANRREITRLRTIGIQEK